MGRTSIRSGKLLRSIYRRLFDRFGPQHWWPAESPYEIMVGAILTQNTNWHNAERAIANLKRAGIMSPDKMHASGRRLSNLIKPAGFYRQKFRKLRFFLRYFLKEYRGDHRRFRHRTTARIRNELLGVWGIGPETADSILLYALGRPVFVIDAYTRRIISRHRIVDAAGSYENLRALFEKNIKPDRRVYNEYHALLVRAGKTYCRKHEPLCADCPLNHV